MIIEKYAIFVTIMLLKQVNQDDGHDIFVNFDFHDDNLLNVEAGDLQFGVRKEHKRASALSVYVCIVSQRGKM
jgi:hypothetical protein